MSQGDILEVLKKQKEPISAKEIGNELDINEKHIHVSIKILLKYDEVKCIEIPREIAMVRSPGCKRRMRLYYVPK